MVDFELKMRKRAKRTFSLKFRNLIYAKYIIFIMCELETGVVKRAKRNCFCFSEMHLRGLRLTLIHWCVCEWVVSVIYIQIVCKWNISIVIVVVLFFFFNRIVKSFAFVYGNELFMCVFVCELYYCCFLLLYDLEPITT